MLFGTNKIATGTAFVFRQEDQAYLITNWHNVTGINPQTGKHLSPNASEPDRIHVWLTVKDNLGKWASLEIPVVDPNDNPLWLEHPTFGRKVDVVAIPFTCSEGLTIYPINEINQKEDMEVQLGHDIFILGFPFNLKPTGSFPVWKRGSIATEPDIDIDGSPKFMVDTASRNGMSGSPVILRAWHSYTSTDESIKFISGTATKFLGIYSGRIGDDDEFKAQLGIIWRADVILEIISGQKIGGK